ncbi:MAG: hypothetical protein M0006_14845 [Magnetospirillum sp.]|nr:hypothetical protein [Magnetospirillum sp.]
MSRRFSAAIAALFLFPSAPVMAKSACNTPAEIGSMQYRQLQIELMVATLKCGGGAYDYRGHYADYLRKAGPGLARNAKELRAMFVRQGKGGAYLDRYLTGMSNDMQIRSQTAGDYCEREHAVMERIAALSSAQLPGYAAETVGTPYGAQACAARRQGASSSRKAVKKAARRATVEN